MDNKKDLEIKRKHLYYISCRRGTKENDLMFKNFCEQYLHILNEADLVNFEKLLHHSDPEIMDWISGREIVPKALNNDLWRKFYEFLYDGT